MGRSTPSELGREVARVLSLVVAVIKPHKLTEVKEALAEAGVLGLTVGEVKGFGRQGGHTETYRGAEYSIDFVPKLKVEVLVASADAEHTATVLGTATRSGKIGDGKIWMVPVDSAVRVRTGERGLDAV